MKKFVFTALLCVSFITIYAQHYETLYVDSLNSGEWNVYCADDDDLLGIIIYGTDCPGQTWTVLDYLGQPVINEENLDSIVISNLHERIYYTFYYHGCDYEVINHGIDFVVRPTNPFSESFVWKRSNLPVILNAGDIGVWSTGETGESIEVSEPGMYSVTLTNDCGPVTYPVEVRDNVEIYRATTDLVTNLNQVTWNTTPEQSEYITAVKVYRNNELVGTVPYTDGVFIDNIGSGDTQWQYHIVGVSVEGEDCPIPSYWKRTIHLDRVLGAQGQYILQWTPYEEESPAKDEVTAYGIYDVVNGIPNHVIDVGYFTNVYAYNPADFHGYGAVAAIFAEKGLEELAFSNVTSEMLNVGENLASKMRVYPNPANGVLFVETLCATSVPAETEYRIMNPIGQTLMRGEITSEKQQIDLRDLPNGVYFITVDGVTRKFVVE